MERGGSEAFIGASSGCGVAGISSSVRASPGGFGMRARRADPMQGEQEVGGDLGGALLAAAAACEREGEEERATRACGAGTLASWRLPGRPLAALALRLAMASLACGWAGVLERACVFFKQKENSNRRKLIINST